MATVEKRNTIFFISHLSHDWCLFSYRPVFILISFVQGEFTENGSETHFAVEKHECSIKATSSGRKRNGIVHSLLVDGIRIEEAIE